MLDGTVTTYIKLVNYNTQRDDFLQNNVMSNKHVTISNCNRLHQFLTNHKFQVPAIFNIYPVFPTAIFSYTNSLQRLHHHRKDQQLLNQTDPQFWHCNDTENKV